MAAPDDEIAVTLHAWTAQTGAPPTTSEWGSGPRAAPEHPGAALVRRRFGSWHAALDAAGLPPQRTEWTRERGLDAILTHVNRHGRPPLSSQWRNPNRDETPPTHIVINRFGS